MFGAELVTQSASGLAAHVGGGQMLTLADGSQVAQPACRNTSVAGLRAVSSTLPCHST
jgi:hypothetical protein